MGSDPSLHLSFSPCDHAVALSENISFSEAFGMAPPEPFSGLASFVPSDPVFGRPCAHRSHLNLRTSQLWGLACPCSSKFSIVCPGHGALTDGRHRVPTAPPPQAEIYSEPPEGSLGRHLHRRQSRLNRPGTNSHPCPLRRAGRPLPPFSLRCA